MEEIKLNLENLSKEERELLMKLVEKANKPKAGRWKPDYGKDYYFVISNAENTYCRWADDSTDKQRFAIGNVFKTKEDAEFAAEKRKVEVELQDIADELNDGWVPDFTNATEQKYCISYNYRSDVISVNWNQFHKFAVIYFKNETVAVEAIKRIGEERLKKYYFEVE